ncbi:MAG: phosphatidylglycerophosphatase A [Deltaproteobacteria bacterium]|nr:phosphatidylglycerophosphatase A [Deltaproteobacteria bacterium]
MRALGNFIRAALSTALGFGYSPLIPGTIGSLPAMALFLAIAKTVPTEFQTWAIAACLLISCFLSILLGPWAQRYWGRKDPRQFVLDEVAGFLVTVLLFRTSDPLQTALWAFVATRFFDIVKPFPARRFEGLPGGWGILLDDLAASLYAAGALHAVHMILGWV